MADAGMMAEKFIKGETTETIKDNSKYALFTKKYVPFRRASQYRPKSRQTAPDDFNK
jgi:hypothetical protein